MIKYQRYLTEDDKLFIRCMRNHIPKDSYAYLLLLNAYNGNPVCVFDLEDALISINISKNVRNFLQSMSLCYEFFPLNGH